MYHECLFNKNKIEKDLNLELNLYKLFINHLY